MTTSVRSAQAPAAAVAAKPAPAKGPEAKLRAAWAPVVGAAVFDKRWNLMPPETKAPFLDVKANRDWMLGNGKDDRWDRRFHQMADTTLWMEILVKGGYMSKPTPRWMEVMMIAGYSVDSGDVASRDGVSNILGAGKSWGMRPQVIAEFGAMVGSTGSGGVFVEQFIKEPKKAAARVREIVSAAAKSARVKVPQLTFLDDPKELRAFAEALLCVKLADASRGQYGHTAGSLAKSTMGRDPKIVQWKKAVDAERKPAKAKPVAKAKPAAQAAKPVAPVAKPAPAPAAAPVAQAAPAPSAAPAAVIDTFTKAP